MVYPREVLNKLRWTEGESMEEAVVWYIHRGAPGDLMRIEGRAIVKLDKVFFDTGDASIPYHRIVRIEYRGRTIFEKPR